MFTVITATASDTNEPEHFDSLEDLQEILHRTASVPYSSIVMEWAVSERTEPLVMDNGSWKETWTKS